MRLFFVLGSHPALSVAEIAAVAGSGLELASASPQILLTEARGEFRPEKLMARLGGTVKVGRVVAENLNIEHEAVVEAALAELLKRRGGKRLAFGVSAYAATSGVSRRGFQDWNKIGMEIKNRLKEEGVAARWVRAQDGPALSSVAVDKNHLLEEGAELVLLLRPDGLDLGATLAVQPFEEFSAADYGRPARDTWQGMLPPKLARLMINLAGAPPDGWLFDPFCGSGTVLTEAWRLGFGHVIGSDKNPEAVESTKRNLEWLKRRQPEIAADAEVFEADARQIGRRLGDASITAIVTEPYLGQPRRGRETRGELQRQLDELQKLYYESLSAWRPLLRPGAAVVMVLPIYRLGEEKHGLRATNFSRLGFELENLVPADWLKGTETPETKNRGLVYGRPDQLVWREIIRLRYHG